ncbi:phosphate butyryltransferase [candidate division WOR-3 bacterium]|nr:phosphate butyryltransferase [candidate division WOR-3 bacterium]
MSIKNFNELGEAVGKLPPVALAVAAAQDEEVIGSLKIAVEKGFVGKCFLAGDKMNIEKRLVKVFTAMKNIELMEASSDKEAAVLAVKAVREEGAEILVKGSLKSELYLKAILDKETGIKASSVLSNLSLFEMESYHKFFAVSDNAIVICPSLEEKKAIIENTKRLWDSLGVKEVKVAALAAVETVNSKMQATLDAAVLQVMSARGQLKGFVVEGPLGYDAAINRECAIHKGLKDSVVCGDLDFILAPNLETANSLGKSYKFHGGATWGGMVFGAKVPCVLNSRSDDEQNRFNSLLIARAIVHGESLFNLKEKK